MTPGAKGDASEFFVGPREVICGYRVPASISQKHCRCFRGLKLVWNSSRQVGYAQPMPSAQELDDFYRTEYRQVMTKGVGLDCYVSSPNYRAQVRSQAQWVMPHVAPQGECLDVGAGYGLLLREIKRGLPQWKLCAVEADPNTHADLSEVADVFPDFASFWDRGKPPIGQFDVVSLSHVLEHLRDPWSALARIRQHLRPGGLLIVEVPNDHHARLLEPIRDSDLPHLWFYSLGGLNSVIEAAGLEIVRSAEIGIVRRGQPRRMMDRARRFLKIRFQGPLSLLDDRGYYAEGSGRTDARVLARRPA